jgi:molecular chaperone DnaK
MKSEAAEHAADDAKLADLVDARNNAEHLAYQTEKQLKEHGEKVPADERGQVEQAVSHLREVAKGDDADAIKKATEALMASSQTIGKIIYEEAAKQAAAAGAAPGAAGPAPGEAAASDDQPPKGDDVIDADFEVKESK